MMSQDEFCSKLKPAKIPAGKLWLTATRLDIIADVSYLQTQVTQARVKHLKEANAIVARAKAEVGNNLGLHFRRLRPPLRLACIHDSSAAGSTKQYAQEGVLVLLMEDRIGDLNGDMEKTLADNETVIMGGAAHILWGHGAKAKRISYSTSHAETLAAVSGLETSSLVAVRLAEVLYMSKRPSIQGLLACQEGGELASGDKSVPQDKGQRLYILAFREARLHGRVRWLALTPTQSMTADGLTKSMVAPPLMALLSTGVVQFYNHGDHKMILRRLPQVTHVTEEQLHLTDKELIKMVTTASSAFACTMCTSRPTSCFFFSMIQNALASTTSTSSTSTSSRNSSTTTTSHILSIHYDHRRRQQRLVMADDDYMPHPGHRVDTLGCPEILVVTMPTTLATPSCCGYDLPHERRHHHG